MKKLIIILAVVIALSVGGVFSGAASAASRPMGQPLVMEVKQGLLSVEPNGGANSTEWFQYPEVRHVSLTLGTLYMSPGPTGGVDDNFIGVYSAFTNGDVIQRIDWHSYGVGNSLATAEFDTSEWYIAAYDWAGGGALQVRYEYTVTYPKP